MDLNQIKAEIKNLSNDDKLALSDWMMEIVRDIDAEQRG